MGVRYSPSSYGRLAVKFLYASYLLEAYRLSSVVNASFSKCLKNNMAVEYSVMSYIVLTYWESGICFNNNSYKSEI